jgi:hypothetical protein
MFLYIIVSVKIATSSTLLTSHYGSYATKKGHRFRVFDNMVLRRKFRLKKETDLSQARRNRKEGLQEAPQCYVTTRFIFFVSQAFVR